MGSIFMMANTKIKKRNLYGSLVRDNPDLVFGDQDSNGLSGDLLWRILW